MINTSKFEQKLLKWDKQLSLEYPLNKRWWKTFEKVCPHEFLDIQKNSPVSSNSRNKLWEVRGWYEKQYPLQSHLLDTFGYKPFILNSKLYHIRIEIYGHIDPKIQNQKILSFIEDMSDYDKSNLSNQDLQTIENQYNIGCDFLFKLNQLENRLKDLDSDIAELLEAGIFDIHIALSSFQSHFYYDAQPVMFHAHQAVEKFLKALYLKSNLNNIKTEINSAHETNYVLTFINQFIEFLNKHCSFVNIKKFCSNSYSSVDDYLRKEIGHNLKKLNKNIKNIYPDFNQFNSQINDLKNAVPDMRIRYINSNKNLEDAITCIDFMINICNYVVDKFLTT